MKSERLTYVDYDSLDPFKVMAQKAARGTAHHLERFGLCEVEESRGESAYVIEFPDCYIAHVEEGLGTKNLLERFLRGVKGSSYYDAFAQDTVAMIVNDLAAVGALPISIAMHVAVGDETWFDDQRRSRELIYGWKEACDLACSAWGGGETPVLRGIVEPGTALLSGSGIGIIRPKRHLLLGKRIKSGDAIVLVESSGIHANGLTTARELLGEEGFTGKGIRKLRRFARDLATPTIIYVPLLEMCQRSKIPLHYIVPITGHGWRKLMRAPGRFTYTIEDLPKPQPVFKFIQEHGSVSSKKMYATFNMGAGLALYLPRRDIDRVIKIARILGMNAWSAGYIIATKEKKVVIAPLGIEFKSSSLRVR